MNFNTQMYFFWFLVCSTTAKHMRLPETSVESQRSSLFSLSISPSSSSQLSRSSFSSESNTISVSNREDRNEETTFPSLSFDSGGRGNSWNHFRLKNLGIISERSYLDSSVSNRQSNVYKRHSESDSIKKDLSNKQNDISSNVTQINETNTDDSAERDTASSNEENSSERDFHGDRQTSSSSSSTVVSVDSNSIQKIIPGGGAVKIDDSRSLKRVFLTNRSIVCNDGSQAGFYLRRSMTGSAVWVVFLEGGWYCHDRTSCRSRWLRLRHLMTSSHWTETRDINGILSVNPLENPYWHEANHVSVPYCSSDTWSGTAPPSAARDSFHFMGKLIVNQVIRDLVPLGLKNSSWLILAGSSAGGTGVMLNLDPVQRLLKDELGLGKVAVRGISDSGWFLDRTPYSSPSTLPAVDAIKKGYALWHGSLPKKCVDLYPQEPWRCYFGYRLYPTIRAPLFVFQWLFDEAQMTADNVGAPETPQQWDYIYSMGRALRASFANVSAVFAPSCVSHSVLTKKDWLQVKIDDVSVAKALRCWELSTMKKPARLHPIRPARKLVRSGFISVGGDTKSNDGEGERPQNRRRKRKKHSHDSSELEKDRNENDPRLLTPGNGKARNRHQRYQNNRRNPNISNRHPNRPKHQNKNQNGKDKLNIPNCGRMRSQRLHPNNRRYQANCDLFGNIRRHGRNRNRMGSKRFGNSRHRNETSDKTLVSGSIEEGNKNERLRSQRSLMRNSAPPGCEHRHIERCSWPQCSHSCPRLLDPYTGEEVQFIDMLKSFGMRIDSMAQALGVDLHTLNNMEHAELLALLTQQIN